MPLPDSQLLQGVAGRLLVRVVFTVDCPFGLGAESGARQLSTQVFNQTATKLAPSSYAVSRPEVKGGVFVIDFRLTRNITVNRYKAELESLGGGLLCKLRVNSVDMIEPVEVNQNQTTGAENRQRTALEAEESRREATTNLRDLASTAGDVFKTTKTLVVVGVLGAVLFATWPLITQGAAAGARLLKRKG